jgi:hypothetical protein
MGPRYARSLLACMAFCQWLVVVLALSPSKVASQTVFDVPGLSAGQAGSADPANYAVESKTGGATYTYRFALPPGRGPVPQLTLAYASNGRLRGSVATGWTLESSASIERDVRRETRASDPQFTAFFYGGRRELVRAPGDAVTNGGTAYRARIDGILN